MSDTMRFCTLAVLALLFLAAPEAEAQRRCTTGKPCGNTCIAQSATCRVGTVTATRGTATSRPAATPAASTQSPVAALPEEMIFVASSRGQVYYPRGCTAARSLSANNIVGFRSEAEAVALGLRRSGSTACNWNGPPQEPPQQNEPAAARVDGTCTIARIIDGDTVVCREGDERIRLLLIDAPERSQGEYGQRATAALSGLLPVGTPARVELDVQERDRYGRLLAYLWDVEDRMANEELARLGFAVVSVYPPNVRYVERIRAAADDARDARRGLWSGSAFECAPADHRAGRCG